MGSIIMGAIVREPAFDLKDWLAKGLYDCYLHSGENSDSRMTKAHRIVLGNYTNFKTIVISHSQFFSVMGSDYFSRIMRTERRGEADIYLTESKSDIEQLVGM